MRRSATGRRKLAESRQVHNTSKYPQTKLWLHVMLTLLPLSTAIVVAERPFTYILYIVRYVAYVSRRSFTIYPMVDPAHDFFPRPSSYEKQQLR